MANKVLKLKRSVLKSSYDEALSALKGALAAGADGEPIVARYTEDGEEHVILGIVSTKDKYEIFDNKAMGDDIAKAIAALDFTDTAETNKFVTKVSEVNGVISVERARPTAANVAATAITGDTTKVAVTGDDVKAQIESIATTLKTVQDNAAKYKVIKYSDPEAAAKGSNVKEAYKVVSYVGEWNAETNPGTQVGDDILIYKDQTLKSAVFANQILTLTYILADGSESPVNIDMSSIIIETEVENGIQTVDHKLSIKLDTNGDDTGTGKFLTVGADGLKLDGVTDAINSAVNALDVADTAVEHKFVTAVSETNGKIDVSREQPTAADIATTAIAAGDATVAIAGTDAKTQIENIGKAIKTEEKARIAAIGALDKADAAVSGQFVDAVSEADGVITVNRSNVGTAVIAGFETDATATGTIAATDTLSAALNKLQNKADGGLDAVEAGNGISVGTKTNKKQTITAVAVTDDPVIEVTVNGIGTKEDALFDCGTF